ncbi:hypothetical protein FGSG_12553 [Fusarium graminearum PH-1]|uniref:hypothetical protein n=1 Tax=Gibberella zeae (strain ATCC MYA-4620 / CBS 123657 / FGSC 9075 / NRRL 31084 / PH-1) TaxID=229533 RepID=UPI00021F249D|nr:hypothetical protein FGSG_12553 [Fusarium graminearum PH-1]ESU10367.1 hypothetical protein FGSG_12553 [Fusarium graminearum PH-1]|eukprot:XP_011322866.1 hypothetical protein FGSG_12553 [Fusarium graminearum PH-1]
MESGFCLLSRLAIRRLVISEELWMLPLECKNFTDHLLSSVANARRTPPAQYPEKGFGGEQHCDELQLAYRYLNTPFEKALNLTDNASEYCIYEILGITEVGEQLEAQHGIDSYVILGRLGRDGMIAERYTRSKHAPD